jgi:DNA repair protein SbcC/Rad50
MFILDSLRLRNFRNHRKLDIDFKAGVTGIIGQNGKGKSNVIEAIRFLFQGSLDDTKEKVITLGETTGYVSGTFRLNDKFGELERHLDANKVILRYDGVTYKKATEVKDLWDKLLQITPDIMDNVVIAKQGEIPLLFNGDNSVREKLFQKIFLVPNTTRLRTVILDNYIKTAPAAYGVHNADDLLASLETAKGFVVAAEKHLETQHEVLQAEFEEIYRKKDALLKLLADHHTKHKYSGTIAILKQSIAPVQAEIDGIKAKLAMIDVEDYRKQIIKLNNDKATDTSRKRLIGAINNVTTELFTDEDYQRLQEEVVKYKELVIKETRENDILKAQYSATMAEINEYKCLHGQANCPTCHQAITDIQKLLQGKEQTLKELNDKFLDRRLKINSDHLRDQELKLSQQTVWRKSVFDWNRQLEQYPEVNFNQADLDLATQVVDQYVKFEKEVKDKEASLAQSIQRLAVQQAEFDKLSYVESTQAVEDQIKGLEFDVRMLTERQQKRTHAVVELNTAKATVVLAEDKIKLNDETIAKNKKRDDYVALLLQVYESFHTTEFPRKLIQTYSGIVTEYLNNYLIKFNMPYTARVNDNFGIDVLDDAERILPRVSGGQQVVVGLSLRLALHELFGQAFPLLIIDEGSEHLDEENVQLYFELIKNLKDNTKLKQIIIIDHHKGLSQVVDNVVNL